MSVLSFEMGTMCGIMLRAVLKMIMRNTSQKGPMCFRCLMFSLSGPFEFLFFTLFYCLLDMSCGEYNVISLYFLCCSVIVILCPFNHSRR